MKRAVQIGSFTIWALISRKEKQNKYPFYSIFKGQRIVTNFLWVRNGLEALHSSTFNTVDGEQGI
jgi:hypothetical protein